MVMCYCYGDASLLWWCVIAMVMCYCYGDVLLLWWCVTVMVMCYCHGDASLLWWCVTYGNVLLLWWCVTVMVMCQLLWCVTVMVMCYCYGDVLLLWWCVTCIHTKLPQGPVQPIVTTGLKTVKWIVLMLAHSKKWLGTFFFIATLTVEMSPCPITCQWRHTGGACV